MSQPTLKSLLGKRSQAAAWLQSWTVATNQELVVEDDAQNMLFGTAVNGQAKAFPVMLEEEVVGWVKGEESVSVMAPLLSLMLQKEAEKKKLGTEVLNLYQELNVIYNFSEKLAQTIDPDVIAQLTLEQAMHSIPSHSGLVVLWDEENRRLNIPAKLGEPLFNEDSLRTNTEVLLHIGLSGQSQIINDLSELKDKGIVESNVESLIYAAMKVKHRIMGAIILAGLNTEQYAAGHLKLLVTLALQSSAGIESAMLFEKNIREVKEREEAILRIHEVTKKFVPNEFISLLGKKNLTDVKLGDQAEKIVTVLFTDIRDFTTMSEEMTPEENFRFVSSFNERLGPIIRENNGFINQYLGDSIMAIFPGNSDNALTAAVAMQRAVHAFNEQRQLQGLPSIRAGIGMHTGPLIMGITGDEFRLDAATISDTVNTAARIESLTKYYKSPLLLSYETFHQLSEKQSFNIRQLGSVRLKGKHKVLGIFECVDGHDETAFEKKIQTLAAFNEAMHYYQHQQFENASLLFESVLITDPGDHTAKYFIENITRYLRDGVPENWTGAEEMMSK